MSNAHSPRPKCPVCGRAFDDGDRLRHHQKSKRHTATDMHRPDDRQARVELQKYHQDRVAERRR